MSLSENIDPVSEPPADVYKMAVVIWYMKNCDACKKSEWIFKYLKEFNPTEIPVYTVEATPERLKRFPHVTMVPQYDVLTRDPASTSPYAAGTSMESVLHNNLARLRVLLPGFLSTVKN